MRDFKFLIFRLIYFSI